MTMARGVAFVVIRHSGFVILVRRNGDDAMRNH